MMTLGPGIKVEEVSLHRQEFLYPSHMELFQIALNIHAGASLCFLQRVGVEPGDSQARAVKLCKEEMLASYGEVPLPSLSD